MSMRTRTSALTALTVAAVAVGTALTAPAAGAARAAAPRFLSASQSPPHPTSSWTAGPVTEGSRRNSACA
ncbi:Sensor domain-containing protein OS=Streptomyces tendae OX=1932 GN=GUR47_06800 PE=4 SV=1 [Streptomyces tendae]